ncbi:uncharacterized protein LOC119084483 [Bradysia coprophila]|uniref:uncharacterized protein LOC119084483 n=1 Tax=Bradysia coprophila TaxID=38358 RepID=UPI00187D72B0|nr:uncharacterized protein LOC119084483 [Bradysia coprophila]XP_037050367.1 uncharacterized protein LOC119084483 [Bradysia coprophila]
MTNAKKLRTELSLDVLTPTSIPLDVKIMEFKEDPEKMDEMIRFVDEIVENAQKQAELRVIDNKALLRKNGKGHTLLYGIKRGRIITRARSAVVRIFEAICNCTNSSPQITRQLPSDQPTSTN